MGFRVYVGYCPKPPRSILGVLLRAIYVIIIIIIQLLLRGGQYPSYSLNSVKGVTYRAYKAGS